MRSIAKFISVPALLQYQCGPAGLIVGAVELRRMDKATSFSSDEDVSTKHGRRSVSDTPTVEPDTHLAGRAMIKGDGVRRRLGSSYNVPTFATPGKDRGEGNSPTCISAIDGKGFPERTTRTGRKSSPESAPQPVQIIPARQSAWTDLLQTMYDHRGKVTPANAFKAMKKHLFMIFVLAMSLMLLKFGLSFMQKWNLVSILLFPVFVFFALSNVKMDERRAGVMTSIASMLVEMILVDTNAAMHLLHGVMNISIGLPLLFLALDLIYWQIRRNSPDTCTAMRPPRILSELFLAVVYGISKLVGLEVHPGTPDAMKTFQPLPWNKAHLEADVGLTNRLLRLQIPAGKSEPETVVYGWITQVERNENGLQRLEVRFVQGHNVGFNDKHKEIQLPDLWPVDGPVRRDGVSSYWFDEEHWNLCRPCYIPPALLYINPHGLYTTGLMGIVSQRAVLPYHYGFAPLIGMLDAALATPVFGDLMILFGVRSADAKSITDLLGSGQTVGLILGGVREQLENKFEIQSQLIIASGTDQNSNFSSN
jgi:hypothetical protein